MPSPLSTDDAGMPPIAPHPAGDVDAEVSTGEAAESPFGLPVLDEVPELAKLLGDLRQVDRLIARSIAAIQLLTDTALAEHTTGVGLDDWIGLIARRTATDTRMLMTAAAVLRRIPCLENAFAAGEVSWAQVRAVVLEVRPLPRHLDDRIDGAIAAALTGIAGADPDALTRAIGWELAALDDTASRPHDDAHRHEFLAMQPRLDGTGGRLHGELGPTSWAIVDAALNTAGDTATAPESDRHGERSSSGHAPTTAGKRRLDRLVRLLDTTLDGAAPAKILHGGRPASSRPQLLLRADLATLIDRSQLPAELLTTLTGGHVRLTAAAARRLIDERGADLRTIVLDDTGSPIGVGRRTRIAPGWLRDTALALHTTCSAPGCLTAARTCDLDHARPWYPTRPHDAAGSTDIGNLAPVCPHHNRGKEPGGWRVHQHPDGIRRWHHQRAGLTTHTIPATWRPRQSPTEYAERASGHNGTDPPCDRRHDPTAETGRATGPPGVVSRRT